MIYIDLQAFGNALLHLLHSFTPQPVGWVIIVGLMFPIFGWAVYTIILVKLHLADERNVLSRCKVGLTNALRDEETGVLDTDIENWLCKQQQGTVGKAIQTVWDVHEVSNPDLEAISTMLAQSESARLGFARIAPNLLLLAGLLGTVVGLAGVVGHLDLVHDASTQLGGALEEMQNAFACTLWGILASLVISLWAKHVSGRQSDFLGEVEEFCIRKLAPAIFPRAQTAALDEIRKLLVDSRQFMKRVVMLMEDSASKFKATLDEAAGAMISGIEGLQQVSADIRTAATNLGEGAQAVRGASDVLNNNHEKLRESYARLEDNFGRTQRELLEFAEKQMELAHNLQESIRQTTLDITTKMDKATTTLLQSTQAFGQMGEHYTESRDAIIGQIGMGFTGMIGDMRTMFSEHREVFGDMRDTLQPLPGQLTRIGDRLDPSLFPMGEWRDIREALLHSALGIQYITEQHANLQTVLQHLSDAHVQMPMLVTPNSEIGSAGGIVQQTETLATIFQQQIQPLTTELQQIARELRQRPAEPGALPPSASVPLELHADLQQVNRAILVMNQQMADVLGELRRPWWQRLFSFRHHG